MQNYMNMPYMQTMNMPGYYYQMAAMPAEQLEAMYPKTYHIVYPRVKHRCDMFDSQYGIMQCPTREQLDAMIDDIQKEVEKDVEAAIQTSREGERQLGFGGRRLLSDLIGILLIRQLISRRRPFSYGYPYGYSYSYGYPGFGGYGF